MIYSDMDLGTMLNISYSYQTICMAFFVDFLFTTKIHPETTESIELSRLKLYINHLVNYLECYWLQKADAKFSKL